MGDLPPKHARGYAGEQHMGFWLGERGYYFVEGPSGSGGHGITQSGFDGVAFNPELRQLIIYDNKSFGSLRSVGHASAIDPEQNLLFNLQNLIGRVERMDEVPDQKQILEMLRQTRQAVQRKSQWPANVSIAVSNAGGRSQGLSERLSRMGIKFIDFYQAPQSKIRSVISNQDVAAAIGGALGALAQWLGDIAIECEVRSRLDNELAPAIRSALVRGQGVLVIVSLQEWEIADFQGRRARGLLDVYLQPGQSEQKARREWAMTPHLLKGAPKGWRVVNQYAWISLVP